MRRAASLVPFALLALAACSAGDRRADSAQTVSFADTALPAPPPPAPAAAVAPSYEVMVGGVKLTALDSNYLVRLDTLERFPAFRQQSANWCWAASGQMIMQYVFGGMTDRPRVAPLQCVQRNRYSKAPRRDCCPAGTPGSGFSPGGTLPCDNPGLPEFARYDFSVDSLPGGLALPWDALRYQLHVLERPVAFSWRSPAHMMVAIGFSQTARESLVIIRDPKGRYGPVLSYRAGYARGPKHNLDYFNIRYTGQ